MFQLNHCSSESSIMSVCQQQLAAKAPAFYTDGRWHNLRVGGGTDHLGMFSQSKQKICFFCLFFFLENVSGEGDFGAFLFPGHSGLRHNCCSSQLIHSDKDLERPQERITNTADWNFTRHLVRLGEKHELIKGIKKNRRVRRIKQRDADRCWMKQMCWL